jgi:hypothetical protein
MCADADDLAPVSFNLRAVADNSRRQASNRLSQFEHDSRGISRPAADDLKQL